MAGKNDYQALSPGGKKAALARWHKNQGTDSPGQLSPNAKQALLHKRYLAEEVAPGLTRGDVLSQTKAAVGQKYGDASAALTSSVQQNQAQAQRTAGWYDQYRKAIAEAGTKQAAATTQAVAGVSNLQQNLSADSQKQWAGEQATMSADASSRGASTDPTLATQAKNASGVRGVLTNSYGAMLLNSGKAQQDATADRGATSVQQKIEALGKKQTERADLAAQRVRLNRDKGDFKVTYAAGLKSGAEDSALKRALANYNNSLTGAKTADTKAKTAQTKAETAFLQKFGRLPSSTDPSSAQAQKDAANLAYYNKHGYFIPTGPPKPTKPTKTDPSHGPGSLSSSQEQKRLERVRTVSSLFRNGVVVKDNTGAVLRKIKGGDVAGIRKYLLTEKALDPLAVQIGLALYNNKGKLGRDGVAAAHKYGIHIGGNFGVVGAADLIPGVKP